MCISSICLDRRCPRHRAEAQGAGDGGAGHGGPVLLPAVGAAGARRLDGQRRCGSGDQVTHIRNTESYNVPGYRNID